MSSLLNPKKIILFILFTYFPLSSSFNSSNSTSNIRPVIGIVTNPSPENSNNTSKSILYITYTLYAESIGANVLPIFINYNDNQLTNLIQKVNGIIFQGGMRDLNINGYYEQQSKKIITYANKFQTPILFICQGFELLLMLLSNNNSILTKYNSFGYALSSEINTSIDIRQSRMFKFFSDDDLKLFQNKQLPSTLQFHYLGITPDDFNNSPYLKENLIITSFSSDADGKRFVNTVESKDFSKSLFFGVQFHPEKSSFSKNQNEYKHITFESMKISNLIGIGFGYEVMKNYNKKPEVKFDNHDGIFESRLFAMKKEENYYEYDFNIKNYYIPVNINRMNEDNEVMYIIVKVLFVLVIIVGLYFMFIKKSHDHERVIDFSNKSLGNFNISSK